MRACGPTLTHRADAAAAIAPQGDYPRMATLCRKRVADTLELSAVKAPRLQPMASGDRALGTHGSDATAATPLQPAAPASPNSCRQRLAWLRTHKDEPVSRRRRRRG